mmetsp:Transcript_10065/g.29544  ORF Transcript_10065/g.29544 Transcript_10065/m.29544 type:complete len:228 (+) Transcript_10065:131-814(+)
MRPSNSASLRSRTASSESAFISNASASLWSAATFLSLLRAAALCSSFLSNAMAMAESHSSNEMIPSLLVSSSQSIGPNLAGTQRYCKCSLPQDMRKRDTRFWLMPAMSSSLSSVHESSASIISKTSLAFVWKSMANSLSASRSFWRSSSSFVSELPTASVHSSLLMLPSSSVSISDRALSRSSGFNRSCSSGRGHFTTNSITSSSSPQALTSSSFDSVPFMSSSIRS